MCVEFHIDQTLRNKNLKIRNEIVERGAVTKGYMGNKPLRGGESGRMLSVEGKWVLFKKESWSSRHGQTGKRVRCFMVKGTIIFSCTYSEGEDWRAKFEQQRSKPCRKVSLQKGVDSHADCEQHAIIRDVTAGILPCVIITSLNTECKCGDSCQYPHIDAGEKPSKKSKKSGAEGISCFAGRESSNWLCISRFRFEEVYSTESGTDEIECISGTHRKILRRHLAPNKNSGKKRAISRNYLKVWALWA